MHILLQLISRKTPVFFISDENSGWLPISLLLIIFFSFDLDYDCSVRRTHLFISFAWWDGLFGRLHRLMHIKNGFRSKLESCESAHMAVAFWFIYLFIYLSMSVNPLASSASCCVSLDYWSIMYIFFYLWKKNIKRKKRKKKDITRFKLLPQLWLLLSSACSESFLWYSVHDMKSLQTSNKPPHVLRMNWIFKQGS